MIRTRAATCLIAAAAIFACLPLRGAEDGQATLDKAMDLRLKAKTLAELREVASLAEQAIQQGLTADEEAFARKVVTGALFDYAKQLCQPILLSPGMTPQLRQLRDKVLPDLQRIVELDDKFGQAHLLIAELQAREGGDIEAARRAVERAVLALRSDPRGQAEALVLRAQLQPSAEQRLADYNRAIELDPENPELWQARALFHLEQGEADKAIADFENLIGKEGDNVMARLAMAEVLLNLGRLDEAQRQIDTILERQPMAIALTLRARLSAAKGDLEQAVKDLDEALKQEPGNPALLLLRARLYYAEGRNALALRDVDEIRGLRPDLAEILELRGAILAALGKFDEAAREIATLLRDNPDNILVRLQLAIYLNAAGKSNQAIERFTEVLQVDPENAVAHRGRADAYLNIGQHDKAIADYEVALKGAPDDSGILNNFAWVLATSPDDPLRNGKRAVEMAEKACQLTDHQEAHILSTLAAAYAEIGDFEQARKWAQQAVTLGDESVLEQLKEELESYQQNKPWRERKQDEPPLP